MRGGTCWVSSGSFFCVCKPGLSGDRCQGIVVLYLFCFPLTLKNSSDSVAFALLRKSELWIRIVTRVTNNRSCRLVLTAVFMLSCFLLLCACMSSRSDRFAFTLNLFLCCWTDVIGHHATIRGGAGHYGLATVNGPELKAPLSLHLNHTHSVYVAVGILVSAITVAVIVVWDNNKFRFQSALATFPLLL